MVPIQNTQPFRGKERFKDTNANRKAQLPGPGAYESFKPLYYDKKVHRPNTQLGKSRSAALGIIPKALNPPSIPSHMNIFGYDENPMGQLVK